MDQVILEEGLILLVDVVVHFGNQFRELRLRDPVLCGALHSGREETVSLSLDTAETYAAFGTLGILRSWIFV